MNQRRILLALFLIYFVFAILLNSVGTVILQVINNYGIDKSSASVLEGFKDLPIAIVSFLVASSLPRFGYKKAMLVALAIVACACLAMPLLPAFGTAKLLFLCVGVAFALVKVSVYTTVGLVAQDRKQHAGIMNTLEGFFMVGVLSAYWIFGWFIDSSNPASTSWLNVYWLLSGLCALTFVLVLFTRFDESEAVAPLSHGVAHDPNVSWSSAPLAAFVFPLIGLFMAPIYPGINSVMLSSLPKHQHAPMTGLLVIFSALGGTTGSMVTGYVFGRYNGQFAFYLTLVPIALVLLGLFFFRRQVERSAAAMGQAQAA